MYSRINRVNDDCLKRVLVTGNCDWFFVVEYVWSLLNNFRLNMVRMCSDLVLWMLDVNFYWMCFISYCVSFVLIVCVYFTLFIYTIFVSIFRSQKCARLIVSVIWSNTQSQVYYSSSAMLLVCGPIFEN